MKTSYTWERVPFSRVLSPTPVFIGCVILTPDAATVGDVTLYDGESDADPEIMTVRTGGGITKVIRCQPPLETKRGLYVKIGSNVEEVLVQYQWERE
jgi:hypothetical protein